jgi:HAD superfamily hydrolase (TIGR01490 family)
VTKAAAIFDLDETIIHHSSGRLLARYLWQTRQLFGFLRRRDIPALAATLLRYRLGFIEATQIMQFAARLTTNLEVVQLWQLIDTWFAEVVIHDIRPRAVERLHWHTAQGHIPVICSASSQFSVQPVADHLGIEHVICTEWLVENGRLTGDVRLPIAYGIGKVHWITAWAAQQDIDLAESYFYTDHVSDRPLLEQVGHPYPVTPQRALRRLAQEKNWTVLEW